MIFYLLLNHGWFYIILLIGRCYYGVDAARKIVYPDSTEYVLCDITQSGTGNVGDMVETDIVYFSFSSERDVGLAKKLNRCYAMQSEEEAELG